MMYQVGFKQATWFGKKKAQHIWLIYSIIKFRGYFTICNLMQPTFNIAAIPVVHTNKQKKIYKREDKLLNLADSTIY